MTPADYAARYQAGESLLDLAHDAGCTSKSMRELLVHVGVTIREAKPLPGAGRRHFASEPTGRPELDPSARILRPSVSRWLR